VKANTVQNYEQKKAILLSMALLLID